MVLDRVEGVVDFFGVKKTSNIGSSLRRVITVTIVVALLGGQSLTAFARQVPDPTSSLFLQTSGPNAGISIGDYYTAPSGGNTDHLFILQVPSDWPDGVPVTLAIYDPELAGPDPSSPTSADEVRGSADTANFSLESPTGSTIATAAYSGAATNGVWVELLTFDPGVTGTGTYQLHVSVSDDDDNSFRIDASHDPDCAVGGPGSCPSASLVSGNETDDAPGGSGKLGLGVVRTSYQHAGSGQVCQDHIFYVNTATPRPLRSHNFDMDGNGSVTYTAPTGASISGTVSGNGVWNNSSTATRVGDVLPDINGWWTATICISSTNQYVFEAPSAGPSFPEAQPTPRLTITKSDGVNGAHIGDELTYSITVANVSDLDPVPGKAHAVSVVDPLPSGVTFVSCDVPPAVSCSESGGDVTAVRSSPLAAGASFTVEVAVAVTSDIDVTLVNTATVSYEDGVGNTYEPVEATDTDSIDFVPVLDLQVTGPTQILRGEDSTVTFALSHAGSSDGSVVTSPVLDCAICSSLTFTGGDDDNDGDLDDGETWTWVGLVPTGPGDPDPLAVSGTASGLDRNGEDVSASASTTIDLVEEQFIGGVVYHDLDGDGVRGPGEPALAGVAVNLSNGSGVVASATTDPDGRYEFDHLFPGDYTVEVDETTLPDGMLATTATSTSVALVETEPSDDIDFGFALPVTISGVVFSDDDGNGVRDAGEAGIEGVTVELEGGSGPVSTTTGPDGSYSFTSVPGSYVVMVADGLPDGVILTTDESHSTGPVLSGESSIDNDFGVTSVQDDDEGDPDDPVTPDDPDDGGQDDGSGQGPNHDPGHGPDTEVDDVDQLPFTGMDFEGLLSLSIALVIGGAVIMLLGRDETDPESD